MNTVWQNTSPVYSQKMKYSVIVKICPYPVLCDQKLQTNEYCLAEYFTRILTKKSLTKIIVSSQVWNLTTNISYFKITWFRNRCSSTVVAALSADLGHSNDWQALKSPQRGRCDDDDGNTKLQNGFREKYSLCSIHRCRFWPLSPGSHTPAGRSPPLLLAIKCMFGVFGARTVDLPGWVKNVKQEFE